MLPINCILIKKRKLLQEKFRLPSTAATDARFTCAAAVFRLEETATLPMVSRCPLVVVFRRVRKLPCLTIPRFSCRKSHLQQQSNFSDEVLAMFGPPSAAMIRQSLKRKRRYFWKTFPSCRFMKRQSVS